MFNKDSIISDMRKAMGHVERARPIIERLLNGGKLYTVEGSDDELCVMLDTTCGTDYMQVYKTKGLAWGVTSRMQEIDTAKTPRPFNSFTVRKERASGAKTEWEKRRLAIKCGGIYPYLTMQGFVDKNNGEIMSLAIARTKDIMDYIDSGKAKTRHTGRDQKGQAEFFVVYWKNFKDEGYDIKIYEKQEVWY